MCARSKAFLEARITLEVIAEDITRTIDDLEPENKLREMDFKAGIERAELEMLRAFERNYERLTRYP